MKVWPKPPEPPSEEEEYTGPNMAKYQDDWHEPGAYAEGYSPGERTGMQGREYNPQRHAKKSLNECS
jgi:hypothetical protein